uniref:COP9 signalosome complex subunit 6 n=1 Tax=Trichuris muris TaxID=70415 RepID=A0A5S6R4H0_TRIMR
MEVDESCCDGSINHEVRASFNVILRPTALLSVSEHYARIVFKNKNQRYPHGAYGRKPYICGTLFGCLTGRTVEVTHALPIKVQLISDFLEIGERFQDFRLPMVKQVCPAAELVGCYSVGNRLTPTDRDLHTKLFAANPNIVFMKLNFENRRLEELPIKFYEAVLDFSPMRTRTQFIPLKVTVVPTQMETITTNDIFSQPLAGADGGTIVTKQMTAHLNAIKIFKSRLQLMRDYLEAVSRDELPCNHALMREIGSFCSSMPIAGTECFKEKLFEFQKNIALDELLNITAKVTADIHVVFRKYTEVYSKSGRLIRQRKMV